MTIPEACSLVLSAGCMGPRWRNIYFRHGPARQNMGSHQYVYGQPVGLRVGEDIENRSGLRARI